MLPSSGQICRCLSTTWSSVTAATAGATAAVHLPSWLSAHTNPWHQPAQTSFCNDRRAGKSTIASRQGNGQRRDLQDILRDEVQTSQRLSRRLRSLPHRYLQYVPKRVRGSSGEKSRLTQAQQDDLALLRRYNISRPCLKRQVILAKVLRCTERHLIVDPGYYGISFVRRQDMGSAQSYTASGSPIIRTPASIQPGDYVQVRLGAFETPYGDPQLEPVAVGEEVRRNAVWEQLEERMLRGQSVKGRILNPTAGGYAVGIAGYVALLERRQAALQQTQRIGVLQDFYIHSMDRQRKKITLSNLHRHLDDMSEIMKFTL